ncbi:hypothetical protein QUB43_25200, partial [Microcoleus sp. A6-D4]
CRPTASSCIYSSTFEASSAKTLTGLAHGGLCPMPEAYLIFLRKAIYQISEDETAVETASCQTMSAGRRLKKIT